MPDTNRQGGENRQIDIDRDEDLDHWAKKLDTTPQQVKDAVKTVGNRPDDVEAHLKGVRSTTNSDTTDRANR